MEITLIIILREFDMTVSKHMGIYLGNFRVRN